MQHVFHGDDFVRTAQSITLMHAQLVPLWLHSGPVGLTGTSDQARAAALSLDGGDGR